MGCRHPACLFHLAFAAGLFLEPVDLMLLGYNTNGLASHRWQDGIELLAEIGYRAVGLTIDHACLNPFDDSFLAEQSKMCELLLRHQLRSVIETGARFLLDPRQKHEPTLISPAAESRAARIDFLKVCIDVAKVLGSDAVSFWSGVLSPNVSRKYANLWLVDCCLQVAEYAELNNVQLAFEPEPGMLIETLKQYGELAEKVGSSRFGLTIDIGHVQCVEVGAIPDHLRRWKDRLCNVHIEDMQRGVHDHLLFGQGEIDFPPVMAALREIGYTGCVNVELSRHSHMAPEVMRESFDFLARLI